MRFPGAVFYCAGDGQCVCISGCVAGGGKGWLDLDQ
jgi:hypothetical protein